MKVVALVDSAGKLAGAADYDVFGRVNEVTVRQDVPAAAGPSKPSERERSIAAPMKRGGESWSGRLSRAAEGSGSPGEPG